MTRLIGFIFGHVPIGETLRFALIGDEALERFAQAVFRGNRQLVPSECRLNRRVVDERVFRQFAEALRIERKMDERADRSNEAHEGLRDAPELRLLAASFGNKLDEAVGREGLVVGDGID